MTHSAMFRKMQAYLKTSLPVAEIRRKAEIAAEIVALQEAKHAVILGHNYMEPALFCSIPEYIGDSLELSRKAASTDKDIILFCGVRFMAETAKILSPDKTVLTPSLEAGCSLAESITADDVRDLKQRFPGIPVVTYINTYADVKAECDVCCTSGNAAAVMESLQSDAVIFLPDEFLARNIARKTGKHIIFPTELSSNEGKGAANPDYQVIGWKGRCEVHEQFSADDVRELRRQYPGAAIVTHPECPPEVAEQADFCGGTSAMVTFVENTSYPGYVLLTECAMGENIAALSPHKKIIPACRVRCPHMNLITLEATLEALQKMQHVIEIPEEIRQRAARSVERMLAIG